MIFWKLNIRIFERATDTSEFLESLKEMNSRYFIHIDVVHLNIHYSMLPVAKEVMELNV